MKEYVILILILFLASCCGSTTMVGWGYDAATDQRSVVKQAGDTAIWGQIKNDLLQSGVKGTEQISVFCFNGIVVLAGVVAKGSEAGTEAMRIAHRVQGVKKVETFFLPSQQSQISDFEIKEKIHFKMVGDSDLMAAQVDMAVIDGDVALVGVVSSLAKVEKIIAIARATDGVKAVKSFIQVKQ
jgi:osmotically-inducible protein OsmY